jgi:hypothetical protein
MSQFSHETKPSKPAETFTPHKIEFIGEQAGPVEDELKAKFCREFKRGPSIRAVGSAYLARLSFGDSSQYSIALCIRSSVGVDHPLQKRLAQVFAEVFRSDQFLDILFIRDDQEQELRKVCKPFYVASASATQTN